MWSRMWGGCGGGYMLPNVPPDVGLYVALSVDVVVYVVRDGCGVSRG